MPLSLPKMQIVIVTGSRVVDWPHKSPQAFLAYFLFAHPLLEKLPKKSAILYFSTANTLNYGALKSGFLKKMYIW